MSPGEWATTKLFEYRPAQAVEAEGRQEEVDLEGDHQHLLEEAQIGVVAVKEVPINVVVLSAELL